MLVILDRIVKEGCVLMNLIALLRQGCRVRHRQWPPYHYAVLKRTDDGSEWLYHCRPFGEVEVMSIQPTALHERDGWSLAGWSRHDMDLRIQL
jgi:hypothetical protein